MDSGRNSCCFCCPDCCLLFKKRVREAASPGASRHWNRVLFDFGGSLFLKQFLERLFFTQNWIFWRKWLPKWTQNEDPRELFFRKSAKLKKCVWTAPAWTDCIWAHPVESSGRSKNRRKKRTYFRTPLFRQKMQKMWKMVPKMSPKGCHRKGGGASWGSLGACLVPQAIFWLQKWAHSSPKVPPGAENYSKNDPGGGKMTRKVVQKRPSFRLVF